MEPPQELTPYKLLIIITITICIVGFMSYVIKWPWGLQLADGWWPEISLHSACNVGFHYFFSLFITWIYIAPLQGNYSEAQFLCFHSVCAVYFKSCLVFSIPTITGLSLMTRLCV